MRWDESISFGNLLTLLTIIIGLVYQAGVLRTKFEALLEQFKRHVEDVQARFKSNEALIEAERARRQALEEKVSHLERLVERMGGSLEMMWASSGARRPTSRPPKAPWMEEPE